MSDDRPIGVFDSGVGGLSILREIETQLPGENLLYLADTAHCPYGPRNADEIRALSGAIAEFLIVREAKLIVVACNTASVASLGYLRSRFTVPFVGIVPAVKPAAQTTQNKRIGVLATSTTFQGEMFDDLVQKFADGVAVIRQVCPGWVEMVEAGEIEGPMVQEAVVRCVAPLLDSQVDAIVLGCTHYPFLRPVIERLVGKSIAILDPAPAVARQAARVLEANDLRAARAVAGSTRFLTTGDAMAVKRTIEKLLCRKIGSVEPVFLDLET